MDFLTNSIAFGAIGVYSVALVTVTVIALIKRDLKWLSKFYALTNSSTIFCNSALDITKVLSGISHAVYKARGIYVQEYES